MSTARRTSVKARQRPGKAPAAARPARVREPEPAYAYDHPGVPRWLPLAAIAVSVLGVADGIYLTVAHFTTSAVLLCSDSGVVNCAKVTTSPESMILGIPVAVLGLAFFVAMVALNLPRAWNAGGPAGAWLARVRLAGVIVGMGFALYLVSAELLIIGSICIFCTIVHILTFVLLILVAAGTTQRGLGQLR